MNRYRVLILAAGSAAAALILFVLGVLVGRSTAGEASAAPRRAAAIPPAVRITDLARDPAGQGVRVSVAPSPPVPDGRQLWLVVERADGTRFPERKPCLRDDANWVCVQSYRFADASAGGYRMSFVIVGPAGATSFGAGNAAAEASDPGRGVKRLPPDAQQTRLVLAGP